MEDDELRLGYWLKLVTRKMTGYHDARLLKYNITSAQLGVLIELCGREGQSQREFQQILEIKPATFTGLVSSLEEKGLIKRIHDNEDARINRIYLTEEGKAIKEESFKEFLNARDIMFKGFMKEEQQLLVCWLRKIYNNLEERQGD
ncbi:MarR family winged helix-turn-helix transcriptional regulator [Clostridium sp. UBA4548]|uniref:MarR family winged helix-turn-helix transcriptional regulator n=1 Tax=Clostridium sp. UBA4548 TaxID=1946361 RepID=UPI0025C589CA|nr:MarR family transcriptional regulator [Clostridium sp. UBA4548]